MRWFVVVSVVAACGGSPAPDASPAPEAVPAATAAKNPEHAAIDVDNPTACAACHGTIVAEWEQSMHRRAHHDEDPIYGAMRALRIEKQGEQVAKKCAVCHTPRDPGDDTSAKARTGVSCATCHHAVAVGDGLGADALTFADGPVLHGPKDLAPGASPVHGTGAAPAHMKDGKTLCLACHAETSTPTGAPACTTGPELAQSATDETCVSCHMPPQQGPNGTVDPDGVHRSHAFVGPHRAWYQEDLSLLRAAVKVEGVLAGETLTLTLTNRSGHAFPSGFPGRMAALQAVARDAAGAEVWRAWTDDAMAERPDAVLNKVYVDAEGKPVMPPFSVKLARDNRLGPDEVRTLTWAVPAAAATVDVVLAYRLAPPPAMKALGLADALEAQPRPIAKLTVTR